MIQNKKTQKGLILIGLAAAAVNAQAQEVAKNAEQVAELPTSTVLASRFDSAVNNTTSSVSVLDRAYLKKMQEYRLSGAINQMPGVQGTSTAGQRGNSESLLIRGLNTRYAQVVVDGVKIADSSNSLNNFLSNTSLSLVNRVELLRGPQSVLYGSDAAGGVLGLDTQIGGAQRNEIFAEAGSFDSYRTGFSSRGNVGGIDYGVGFSHEFTGNDTYAAFPIHDFTFNSAVLALGYQVNDALSLKLSYRNSDGKLQTRQISPTFTSNALIRTDYHLLALNTDLKVSENWQSKLTLGYYDEAYDASFPFDSDFNKFSANWSNKLTVNDQLDLILGTEYSRSSFRNSSGQDFDYNTKAVYANSLWRPIDGLLVETGVRYDDHSLYGSETAWNVGAAYELASKTRVRARMAQSYRTPTVVDSQAFSGFSTQLANPNLKTEEIFGFEFGIDHEIGKHTAQLTYFKQQLENAIFTRTLIPGAFPVPATTQRQNRDGKSAVSGVELALNGELADKVNYRLSYTFQDDQEVIDVPDHNLNADVHYDAGKWLVGAGVSYQDGASYGAATQTDSRFITRVYGHYELNDSLKLHGRVENVFDEKYELSNFGSPIQGQGFGAFAGFTYSF